MLTGLSDHNLIIVSTKLNNKQFKPLVAAESYKILRNEQNNLQTSIQQVNWNELILGNNLERDCLTFSSKIHTNKHKAKNNSLPWLNYNIFKLMKECGLALKNVIKTKFHHDKYHYIMLRNKVVKEIRKAKAKVFIAALNEARGNVKMI